MNCYWEMPFRKHARITIENVGAETAEGYFYQIDYTLTDVPEDLGYFHAQWRRNNPLAYMDVHTLLDGVAGKGQYIGAYMAWGANNCGWWGEGEIKFFLDGDGEYPTICGTGVEDYFGGAWCFEDSKNPKNYEEYSTPFLGFPQVVKTDHFYNNQQRFGLYRWHVADPIRFEKDIKVTMQALGWRSRGGRYLPLQDDIASVAFWYQTEPHSTFPKLREANYLEVR